MNLLELSAVVVASYLVGAIPAGYIIVRLKRGEDIREQGSGVIGATNVLRVLGTRWFVLVLILDAAKGYVPTMVAWYIFGTHDMQVAAGIAAVLGHDFPVYIGFRGGRGVATSFGVYAALALPLAVAMVAVGIFIVLALRYMSVMSMVTVPAGALVLLLLAVIHVHEDFTYTKTIFGAFATFFVILTHIPNIKRLIRGTEPKIGSGGGSRSVKAHTGTT
ncbi:MAG TPA: glycerol-3-phosphate 1-O-acyltransferase PlsY [Dehalococcoidia bacterium]|nr:glycerol-3-phosphate 1-O-acyltransferase PlsY [Dehalococcoidia bacterium]